MAEYTENLEKVISHPPLFGIVGTLSRVCTEAVAHSLLKKQETHKHSKNCSNLL